MPDLITPAEYARRRGVSREAVSKAIEKGRISTMPGENGRKLIDPEVADIQWAKNTDPAQAARANAQKIDASPVVTGDSSGVDVSAIYWEARARRETEEAAMAEMKRRQMENDLVERRRVEEASMRIGRMLRDSILGVSTRLAPELAHLTDAWQIEQRIATALRNVLDDIAKLTADDIERAMH